MAEPVYRRVVIKLSGEYLAGSHSFGIDQPTIDRIADDLIAAQKLGVEVAVVIGGGNIVRGVEVSSRGVSRPTGDTMGMLATMMNCLALEAAIERQGDAGADPVGVRDARDFRAVHPQCSAQIPRRGPDRAARRWNRQSVLHHRHHGGVAGGRDRGAGGAQGHQCRRRLQRRSQKDPSAKRFDRLTHSQAIAGGYKVMDATAFALARETSLPIIVFSIAEPGSIGAILRGTGHGTVVAG